MNAFMAICHYDDENLTLRGVTIPDVVGVTMGFDADNVVGRAKLEWLEPNPEFGIHGAIKATVELDEEVFGMPSPPETRCGFVESVRRYDANDGIAYLEGGYVSHVAIVTDDFEVSLAKAMAA